MKFGMGFLSSEGFAATPEPLKARREGRCAHYGVEVCPSVPGGMELIARNQTAVLDAFREPVDILWTWPYDQGGCACDQCAPWGGQRLPPDLGPDGENVQRTLSPGRTLAVHLVVLRRNLKP